MLIVEIVNATVMRCELVKLHVVTSICDGYAYTEIFSIVARPQTIQTPGAQIRRAGSNRAAMEMMISEMPQCVIKGSNWNNPQSEVFSTAMRHPHPGRRAMARDCRSASSSTSVTSNIMVAVAGKHLRQSARSSGSHRSCRVTISDSRAGSRAWLAPAQTHTG